MISRDFRDRLIWIAMNDAVFFGVAWLAYRQGQWGGFFLFFGLGAFGTLWRFFGQPPARLNRWRTTLGNRCAAELWNQGGSERETTAAARDVRTMAARAACSRSAFSPSWRSGWCKNPPLAFVCTHFGEPVWNQFGCCRSVISTFRTTETNFWPT